MYILLSTAWATRFITQGMAGSGQSMFMAWGYWCLLACKQYWQRTNGSTFMIFQGTWSHTWTLSLWVLKSVGRFTAHPHVASFGESAQKMLEIPTFFFFQWLQSSYEFCWAGESYFPPHKTFWRMKRKKGGKDCQPYNQTKIQWPCTQSCINQLWNSAPGKLTLLSSCTRLGSIACLSLRINLPYFDISSQPFVSWR